MAYGTIKIDTITFTDGGIDKSVAISGLVQNPTFTGNVTVTGTISGNTVRGQTISGVTVTGTTANFTSGNFANISGGTHTITSGVFASGTAANPSISFVSDPNSGLYSPGADQVAISTNGTGRLFVGSDGKIGIGTSPGSELLTVNGRVQCQWNAFSNGGTTSYAGDATSLVTGSTAGMWAARSDSALLFAISSNERMRLDSSGRLGLGTSSPSSQLHCTGDIKFGDAITLSRNILTGLVTIADATTEPYTQGFAFRTNETDEAYRFENGDGTSTYLTIRGSGNVGIGTTSVQQALHVSQSGGNGFAGIRSQNSNSGTGIAGIEFSSDSTYAKSAIGLLRGDANGVGSLVFYNASSTGAANWSTADERARIDSSGRLLVGTSSSISTPIYENGVWAPQACKEQFAGITAADSSLSISVFQNLAKGGAQLSLNKSRSSTVGTFGGNALAVHNELGAISFSGDDGSKFVAAASITCATDGTPGANDMPGRLVFSTTADGASSPTERMRLGNDGILYNVSTSHAVIASTTAAAGLGYYLFVGTYGATAGSAGSGTISIEIFSNGNVRNTNNSYTAISDLKLKENIVDANSQWNDIKALRVCNYNFKEGQTHKQIGLIAQEVELICPGLVYETHDRDADNTDLGTTTKSVQYSVLYMKAVKALQEAMERIEQLETEMAAVKAQLS